MSETSEDLLYVNGVDARTGGYLLPPLPIPDVASLALGRPLDERRLERLRERNAAGPGVLAPVEGVDANRLDQAGWGMIFAAGASADPVLEALTPLRTMRRSQAGARFKIFKGPLGVQPGQSAFDWLLSRGVGPGPVNPEAGVPYYLLIVGSPEEIPFQFQFDLDIQFAVGRICFDTLEEYDRYARGVVAAEQRQVALPRSVRFFGVENPDDPATALSTRQLILPLAEQIGALTAAGGAFAGWDVGRVVRAEATKRRLGRLLGGDETPGLLFTASHGAGFSDFSTPDRAEEQRRYQGALMCAEWPGPRAGQPLAEEMIFSGDDLGADAKVAGLMAFFFACFGAGTPHLDEFAHRSGVGSRPRPIAPAPFVARLPQRLLAHPAGGALAVVGHVERGWGFSFSWSEAPQQTHVFEDALRRLLRGQPVGLALESFNQRYAQLGTELSNEQTKVIRNEPRDDRRLVRIWTASNDARGFIVFGDPAARLAVAAAGREGGARGPGAEAGPPAAAPAGETPPAARTSAAAPADAPAPAPGAQPARSVEPAEGERRREASGASFSGGDDSPAPDGKRGGTAMSSTTSGGAGVPELHLTTRSDLAGGGSFSMRLDIVPPAAAPAAETPGATAALGGEDSSFGGGFLGLGRGKEGDQEAGGLGAALRDFAENLIAQLNTFLDDVTTLNVATYTSEDLSQVVTSAGQGGALEDRLAEATPRALTRIKFDGDTIVVVPESAGAIDEALWRIHVDMVREAQAARAEMVRTALDAVAGVVRTRP